MNKKTKHKSTNNVYAPSTVDVYAPSKVIRATPPYKNMAVRRIILFLGLVFVCLGFASMLAGLLILFVPSFNFKILTFTPMQLQLVLNACGMGLSFVGVCFALAGANTAKAIARLVFAFGIIAFIVATAMLVINLFFYAILPIDAIKRLMDAC